METLLFVASYYFAASFLFFGFLLLLALALWEGKEG